MKIPGARRRFAQCLLVVMLEAATGCTAIVDQFSGRSEACDILRTGRPATAKIIDVIDTGITVNQIYFVVEFVLEVYPEKEAPFQARSKAMINRLEVPQAQPGRIVPVKYDPQQRDRVALDLWDCD